MKVRKINTFFRLTFSFLLILLISSFCCNRNTIKSTTKTLKYNTTKYTPKCCIIKFRRTHIRTKSTSKAIINIFSKSNISIMHTLFLSNIVNSFFNTFTSFSPNLVSRIFKESTCTFTKVLSSSSKTSFLCSSFSRSYSTFTYSTHRCSLSLFNSSIATHILKKLNWISKSIKLNYIKYSIDIIHKESSISRLFSNLISYSFLIVSINSFKSISILLNKSSIFFIRHTIKLIKSLSFHIIINLISLLIIFHSTHKSSIKTSFSHTLTSSHSISII